MRILDMYDKNSDLRYRGKNVFDRMDKFFLKFPIEYSNNYYKNLESLRIFRVDKFFEEDMSGLYIEKNNMLLFSNKSSISHELLHMSSYDSSRDKTAFVLEEESFETGLLEGITEYFSMMAFNIREPEYYLFEAFCAEMISNIEGVFEHYFIPSHDGFVSKFSNKKDIYSLMYSLNYYYRMFNEYYVILSENKDSFIDRSVISESIRDVINSLISIELGYEDDSRKLELYSEKFMDLIVSSGVSEDLGLIYPGYKTYANKVINKRIRSKIKR